MNPLSEAAKLRVHKNPKIRSKKMRVLALLRWQKKTKAQRRAHAMLMVAGQRKTTLSVHVKGIDNKIDFSS